MRDCPRVSMHSATGWPSTGPDAIGLDPADVLHEVRRLHACRPYHQLCRQAAAIGQKNAIAQHLGHAGAGVDLHAVLGEQALGGLRQARRQRGQDAAGVVVRGGHVDLAAFAVQRGHGADAVAEAMPVRLRQVVDLVRRHVHAAGGNLVQLGFPDVHTFALDQRDVDAAPQPVAQARGELQPARATADDDDAVARALYVPGGCGAHPSNRIGRVSFSGTSSAFTSSALITPSACAVSAIVARLASAVFATSAAFS